PNIQARPRSRRMSPWPTVAGAALVSLATQTACGARSSLDDGRPEPAGSGGDAAVSGSGGSGASTFVSVACGGGHVCAATSHGAVVCWGYGGRGQLGD